MLTSGGPKEGAGGGGRPALFLDQNEARRVEKILFETGPPLSQDLDERPPPLPRMSGSATADG